MTTNQIQTPHSRNADPLSSHLAGDELTASGSRAKQIDFVVGLVKGNQGKTSRELADISGADRYMIARRLPEAEGIHLKKGDMRTCSIAGRKAVTWWMA